MHDKSASVSGAGYLHRQRQVVPALSDIAGCSAACEVVEYVCAAMGSGTHHRRFPCMHTFVRRRGSVARGLGGGGQRVPPSPLRPRAGKRAPGAGKRAPGARKRAPGQANGCQGQATGAMGRQRVPGEDKRVPGAGKRAPEAGKRVPGAVAMPQTTKEDSQADAKALQTTNWFAANS